MYKPVSQTSSGWKISTDPDAPAKLRWRGVHPVYGTKFFPRREDILEYAVKNMYERFEKREKRRMSGTLADAILRESYSKKPVLAAMSERTVGELRDVITRARRFILDKPMSSFMADLSTAVYRTSNQRRTLDSMRHSALLPHPVTWVEFDGNEFRNRVIDLGISMTLDGAPLAKPGEIPETWGLLMEQHPQIPTVIRLTEIMSGEGSEGGKVGHPMSMPVSFWWNAADAPIPVPNLCTKSGMIGHGVLGYVCPFIGAQLPKRTMRAWMRRVNIHDIRFETHEMVVETSGVVRYALAFLAALNDMPAVHHNVATTEKFYIRGQYKKFLDHTVIRLNIPAKRNRIDVARKIIAAIHRRAHQVRGHWRLYEREKDLGCQHLWSSIDSSNHSVCSRCPSWRTWITEHQRGDASLGFVTPHYEVTHAT